MATHTSNAGNSSTNLNSRQALFAREPGKPTYFETLYNQLQITQETSHILELGSGRGDLWADNLHRLPADTKIVLCDKSRTSLDHCKETLNSTDKADCFTLVDVDLATQSLTDCIPAGPYQRIIAYYFFQFIPEPAALLRTLLPILDREGELHAIANSEIVSPQFIEEVLSNLDEDTVAEYKRAFSLTRRFSVEHGSEVLKSVFRTVESRKEVTKVTIKDPDLFVKGIQSITPALGAADFSRVREAIRKRIDTEGEWSFDRTTAYFVAKDPIVS